jgi:hypothetical protein
MRRRRGGRELTEAVIGIIVTSAACLICGFAVIYDASAGIIVATGCGLGLLLTVAVARRLGLGPRVTLAAASSIIVSSLAVAAAGAYPADGTSRFAAAPSEVVTRMMVDIPWLGNGAGTYRALMPIYAGIDDVVARPPTTADAFAIELGTGMVAVAVAIAALIAVSFVWGAMKRGRDWIYSAVGAAAAVVLTVEAFFDATLLDTTVMTIASVLVGIGLAQRESRTVQ